MDIKGLAEELVKKSVAALERELHVTKLTYTVEKGEQDGVLTVDGLAIDGERETRLHAFGLELARRTGLTAFRKGVFRLQLLVRVFVLHEL